MTGTCFLYVTFVWMTGTENSSYWNNKRGLMDFNSIEMVKPTTYYDPKSKWQTGSIVTIRGQTDTERITDSPKEIVRKRKGYCK